MEERAIAADAGRRRRPLVMECGTRRFPVVAMGSESCLIEAPDDVVPRGFVDIFDGERHVAHCLIILAAPEGPFLHCSFKRRTPPRLTPPRDYAD
jgi:hypothetical protein